MEEHFYFESGLTLHAACAGREVRNLQLVRSAFGVRLGARDGGVTIEGEPDDVVQARRFFTELAHFHALRGRDLDQRDFELLLKAFRDQRGGALLARDQEPLQR